MAAPRVRCPTCQRELEWSAEFPWRPFCSERCRMVDLGAWFAGERSIAADADESGHLPDPALRA
ncbi:MAG TPA: DNA gyrase inhibitor YacG [Steroidobacteraceae bacterium]|nr:DNA gyrase inhibitor YacG [Steroidobacteraceae bacterium]